MQPRWNRVRSACPMPLLTIALLLSALACGGDGATAPQASVVGAYSLKTVNGASLPITMEEVGSNKVEILYGTLTLNTDGTFNSSAMYRVTHEDVTSAVPGFGHGTYTLRGKALTFAYPDSTTESATWDGANEITLSTEGYTVVFRR